VKFELSDRTVNIRPYREDDVQPLFDAVRESVAEAYPWLPWCRPEYTLEDSRTWVSSRAEAWEKGEEFAFVIADDQGHMLVVPKEHPASLSELKPDIGAHLFKVAQHMAQAIRRSDVRCEGINIFMADGEAAGQDVFHVHLHVLPRYSGDNFGLQFGESYGQRPNREELDAIAKDIGGI